MKVLSLPLCFLFLITACTSTPPVKPEGKNIEVSRKPADEDCKEIGPVEGRTMSEKEGFESALKDLKEDAARRGANYVQLRRSGATGSSVRGIAYLCD